MSAVGIYLTAGAAIVGLLLLTEGAARWATKGKKGFITTVILGQDGRTSTSKAFILLWTLLVGWALVSLLIAGELVALHACVSARKPLEACKSGHDQVALLQLGWKHFLSTGVAGSYLVLLGIPAAAGVAAKGITQSKTSGNEAHKTGPGETESGFVTRVAEIFSADDGTTDIGDFQYTIFNLITAVYFVANFVKPNGNGLPLIPDTLLGLTSVSAALYVGKKAVTNAEPTITGVFPTTLRPGTRFSVTGTGLADPTAAGEPPRITINGVDAAAVTVDPRIPDRLTAVTPDGLVPAEAHAPVEGQVQVLTAYGSITPELPVKLE